VTGQPARARLNGAMTRTVRRGSRLRPDCGAALLLLQRRTMVEDQNNACHPKSIKVELRTHSLT
jgi:hypothetical protein